MSCAASSTASASALASSRSWVRTASATSAGVSAPCSSRRWMSASRASATAGLMLISVNELLLFFAGDGRAVSARLPSPLQTVGTHVPFPFSRRPHENLVTLCYKSVRTAEGTPLRRDPPACDERRVGDGHRPLQEALGRPRVLADLVLGELRVAERAEVHQGARVTAPVVGSVHVQREDGARHLLRHPQVEHPLVRREGAPRLGLDLGPGRLPRLVVHRLEPVRAGLADLRADVVRDVELRLHLRVAARPLVVGVAGAVPVVHEEPDEPLVPLAQLLARLVEGHAGAVRDGEVGGEAAVERDEPLVEDVDDVLRLDGLVDLPDVAHDGHGCGTLAPAPDGTSTVAPWRSRWGRPGGRIRRGGRASTPVRLSRASSSPSTHSVSTPSS